MVFCRNKLNIFFIIDYLFLIHWLEIYSLVWVLILSGYEFFWVLNRLSNIWQIYHSIIFFDNPYLFFNGSDLRLTYCFLYHSSTWWSDGNLPNYILIRDFSIFGNLFSIYRSIDFSLSNNGSLNYSLLKNWLGYNFSRDYWLSNYFLLNNWLLNHILSLSYNRLGVIHIIFLYCLLYSILIIRSLLSCWGRWLVYLSSSLRLYEFNSTCLNHIL